jgi:GNAT superfamily N-acetyltransferase
MTGPRRYDGIRRICADEGLVLRDLRVRSIDDAPEAFGQTADEARARAESEWSRSARQAAKGDSRSWFFAEVEGEPVSLVQGRRRRPATLLIFSMWVDRSHRHRGLGRALIAAVEAWARDWGARETVLWVRSGNASALAFYTRLGFDIDSEGEDAESGARYRALALRRPMDGADRHD